MGFAPLQHFSILLSPLRAKTVAVVVPSPATSLVLEAAYELTKHQCFRCDLVI
jgi:hypothetical protein